LQEPLIFVVSIFPPRGDLTKHVFINLVYEKDTNEDPPVEWNDGRTG